MDRHVGVSGCTDKEAAKICCKAARDNKLIYVTLEADSVMNALSKWIQMVEDGSASMGSCWYKQIRGW